MEKIFVGFEKLVVQAGSAPQFYEGATLASMGNSLIGTIKGIFAPVLDKIINPSKINIVNGKKVFAPVNGLVLPITQSADPAHQQEAVGKGVCFMPLGGKIFAPFNGTVEMVFNTKHAIGLKSDDGVEMLIHCGIDTVKLEGKGFTVHVKEGDKIKTGDLILEYDKDIIESSGFSLETQVIVTNYDEYKAITQAKSGDCAVGDIILYVE
jgi:glucose-specific phosphotransferase system IIA component